MPSPSTRLSSTRSIGSSTGLDSEDCSFSSFRFSTAGSLGSVQPQNHRDIPGQGSSAGTSSEDNDNIQARISNKLFQLDKIISDLHESGFTYQSSNNSIHQKNNIQFYQDILKADVSVIKILTEGLTLQFKPGLVPVEPYEEPNNNSANTHVQFLREKIAHWESLGRVKKVSEVPLVVNPLSVAEKFNKETKELKLRPVIDMSRFLNQRILKHHVHLENLDFCESLIEPGEYMTSFDLSDMYHHVHLRPDQYKYFGFKLLSEDGSYQYYVFTVLMFGFCDAVYIVDFLMKPIKAFIHDLGIIFSMYIDDGKIASVSFLECQKYTDFVIAIMQFSGWNINWDKSTLIPTQQLKYLGVVIDTLNMRYISPSYKLEFLKDRINYLISRYDNNLSCTAKEFAAVIGMINDLTKSHGSICLASMRTCHHYLGKHVSQFGWEVSFFLNNQCITELSFFRDIMFQYNGNFIKNSNVPVSIITHSDLLFFNTYINEQEITYNCKLFVSDASDRAAFIYENNHFEIVDEYLFSEEEVLSSSGLRELLAVEKVLTRHSDYFRSLQNNIIFWQTDSQCCFAFLKHGSRKPHIQKIVLRIKHFEFLYKIRIIPIWCPRTNFQMQLADLGSKLSTSTDEWSIDDISIAQILKKFAVIPTVDAFSSNVNAKFVKFFSKIPQIGTSGINFFAQRLSSEEIYWCCPPPKFVVRTIKHILSHPNITGIVILPIWKSAYFWPFIRHGKQFAEFISKFLVFQPVFSMSNNCKNSIFFGKKNFSMLAILVNSNNRNNTLSSEFL